MADPKAAVTDTHPLIFHAAGGSRLGRRAAAFFSKCENGDATIYVPASVMWECSVLVRVGKINLKRSARAFFDDLFSNPSYQPVDITPEQIFLAEESRFNADPFDGLIVAAARMLNLPLITRDQAITGSGYIKTIW